MMTRSLPAKNLIISILALSAFLHLGSQSAMSAQTVGRSRVIPPLTLPKPTPESTTTPPKAKAKKIPEPTPESTPVPAWKSRVKKIPVPNKYADYCAPPFFFCPDAADIFTSLLENNDSFSKGKFEKTAEWEVRRLHLLDDIRISEDLTMGSEMTFLYIQGTEAPENNEPVYDADLEQWSFALHFHPGPDMTTCLPLVSNKSQGLFCLVVPFDMSNVTAALVDMSIADAEKNDGSLQIALVGKVIAKDVYSHGFKVWGFFFDLGEMICINPKTGESWRVKYVLSKPDSAAPPK